MLAQLRPAVMMLLLLTLITGMLYPLAVTGMAQVLFPDRANGSLIVQGGGLAGSSLIGQPFSDPKYFWGRPSATSPFPYNAAASSGSNLGPTNPSLIQAIRDRIAALKAADPDNPALVPVDLVTASASGLDPHISPAAAEYQIPRVARMHGMEESTVRHLVLRHTERRQWGILGEARVDVLLLNLALDAARPGSLTTLNRSN
ncbi:MAG TPA: potassium-transporting ATPase subunit KdpC [Nitrospiraceae bacterium]|nr:potassium-transporting ATPase subunit KdpC [Nitrospiraceae bacterium]